VGPIITVIYLSLVAHADVKQDVSARLTEKLNNLDPASATVCFGGTAVGTKLEKLKLRHIIEGRNFTEDPNLYLSPKQ
jgi:hypothetical protein